MIIEKEYMVDPALREDFLVSDKTTIYQSSDSPTGYMVSFRLKAPERSWLGVIGDWMFSDIYHSNHWNSGRYWPQEWKRDYFAHTLLGLKQTPAELLKTDSEERIDPSKFEFDWDILKLGLYEMKKNPETGVFMCNIPLPSGTFNYRFVLEIPDGNPMKMVTMPDPNNMPEDRKNDEVIDSQIMVPYDNERQSDDRTIELPYKREKLGSVIYETYKTNKAFGVEEYQPVGIYLPHNYNRDREKPYPVLYLSHGGGGDCSTWFTQGSLKNILDHLIGEGKLEPMLVVTMNNEIFHWDNKGKCIPNIMKHLIPYVEDNYHVASEPSQRAFAGFSAGGFLSFDLYSSYAKEFGYFGIWSAGQRNSLDFTKPELKLPVVHIGAGRYDDAFYSFGYKLEDAFNQYGISFTSYFPLGAHQWSVWRKLAEDFLTRVLWK